VATGVDQTVMGDREDPAAQARFISVEGSDVPRDLKEGLAEHVFGIRSSVGAQISEHGRRKLAEDLGPGGLAAIAGLAQQPLEAITGHAPTVAQASGPVVRAVRRPET
jgi:hypothetical protein